MRRQGREAIIILDLLIALELIRGELNRSPLLLDGLENHLGVEQTEEKVFVRG